MPNLGRVSPAAILGSGEGRGRAGFTWWGPTGGSGGGGSGGSTQLAPAAVLSQHAEAEAGSKVTHDPRRQNTNGGGRRPALLPGAEAERLPAGAGYDVPGRPGVAGQLMRTPAGTAPGRHRLARPPKSRRAEARDGARPVPCERAGGARLPGPGGGAGRGSASRCYPLKPLKKRSEQLRSAV